MPKMRAGFGRYELGSKDGDAARINHMSKLEREAESATDAFRELIDHDVERGQQASAQKVPANG